MGVTKCAPGTNERTEITMDNMLLQFLDFIYNEVLIDVDVLERIDEYIKLHYGTLISPGMFVDVYHDWYTENIGVSNE
jgi:hypothetical protein